MAETESMRSKLLVDSYLRKRPKIIIIEYFHFAPRRFGKTLDELFDVINQEQERPIIICSTRTYPMRPQDANAEADATRINELLRKNFSGVFHHADSRFFPLTSLGPYLQAALSGMSVWQTGFVRRPFATRSDNIGSSRGLLLTVGGGSALGARLLKRWITAAKAASPDLLPVNAVCGPLMNVDDLKLLRDEQDENVTVHDWVANMDELAGSSRAIVCLGDQAFQVNALYSQGLLLRGDQSLSEGEITALMNKLLHFEPRHLIDCNGTDRSIEIIKQLLKARAQRASINFA
jgi:predicted glycosyltransferase